MQKINIKAINSQGFRIFAFDLSNKATDFL
jgi:hypothetical protein